MSVQQEVSAVGGSRPARAMVWVLLLASAAAVLVVGLVGTYLLFDNLGPETPRVTALWPGFLAACTLTLASLSLRTLRWIYLLRRAETRIPIRDAYIGYLAGFSLFFAPLLVGETFVRAAINRRRGGVPAGTTVIVNIWERLLDVSAMALIVGVTGLATGNATPMSLTLLAAAVISLLPVARRVALRGLVAGVSAAMPTPEPATFERLTRGATWSTSLTVGLVAWLLPGLGLWILVADARGSLDIVHALHAYAGSSVASGIALMPGGVVVAGQRLLTTLADHGFGESDAVVTVAAIRLATTGVSVVLGLVFVALHGRSVPLRSDTHFDDIADAYDVQIPESRREALLERKTRLMQSVLTELRAGPRGLDVGCGQGTYVARMRELGFDVRGIDASAGQVRLALRHVGEPGIVTVGSVLEIPAPDASFDFLYIINVLHHLGSVEEQRRGFAELLRVLKPGGLLFVHEINTRNPLFRFYMGYVFPSLNCIDEGIERWLLAHQLDRYTDVPVVDVRYFTFLPEFVPAAVVRVFAPVERWLEQSAARVMSAHYMAVLRKPDRS